MNWILIILSPIISLFIAVVLIPWFKNKMGILWAVFWLILKSFKAGGEDGRNLRKIAWGLWLLFLGRLKDKDEES